MENKNTSDEIDVLEIFLKGVNIFRANFWMIISCFVVGSLLGFAYYFYSPKVYENKLIISSSILTESYGKKLIENTRAFIAESNYRAISEQLGLTQEEATKVFSIKIDNLTDFQTDVTKENDRYLITVRVSDQAILPKLQQGIITYFENNDFVKVRVEQSKSYLKQMIAKFQLEIADLEDLKQRINSGAFFEKAQGNVSFDPTTVNSKILELTKERINLQHSLALSNSVQVIEGFTQFEKPLYPKVSLSLIGGSIVGLAFSAAFIFFKMIGKIIKIAEAAKKTA
jgi:hypothetical protein